MLKAGFISFLYGVGVSLIVCLTGPALATVDGPSQMTNTAQQSTNWQLSVELVNSGAAKKYQKKIRELNEAHLLDRDGNLLARLQVILDKLRRQAEIDYPSSRAWQWELHLSDEDNESSYCMAGGKLLMSAQQIKRMELREAELAMLLSHEMAHALKLHHFLEDQEALRQFPQWYQSTFEAFEDAVDEDAKIIDALADFDKEQEFEADIIGMALAHRAGYRYQDLLRFYEKLRKQSAHPNFESRSHPAPAKRLIKLRDWVQQKSKSETN